jgi:hypothetical protein
MLHHEKIRLGVERINSARMVYFAGRPFLDGWSGGMSLPRYLSEFPVYDLSLEFVDS